MLNILRFAAAPTDEKLFMQLYYKFGAPISKAAAQEAVMRSPPPRLPADHSERLSNPR